jgi:voltage-gated potassium channel
VNGHQHHALYVLQVAILGDGLLGLAFGAADHVGAWDGLYFATTTATTVGYGDITPHGWLAHVLAVTIMLTVIPLFASVFSLLTTGLTADHVDKRHDELKDHVTRTAGGGDDVQAG